MALLSKTHTHGDSSGLAWPAALLCLQLAAFWQVWVWYANRLWYSPGEALGLIVLLTVFVLLLQRPRTAVTDGEIPLTPVILFLGLYVILYRFVPPIARAAIAITSVGVTLHLIFFRCLPKAHIWGLFLLALPVVPSLQFYLGYPARVAAVSIAAPLLRMTGLALEHEGAYLVWNGRMVLFDAPCSGIKMLWAGVFVTFALSGYYQLTFLKMLQALVIGVAAVLVGNVLRATSLFYIESGILTAPGWCHNFIGLISYAFVALIIAGALSRLKKW